MTREDLNELKNEVDDLILTIGNIRDNKDYMNSLIDDISVHYETNDKKLSNLMDCIYMEDDEDVAESVANRIMTRINEIEENWTDEDFERDEEV